MTGPQVPNRYASPTTPPDVEWRRREGIGAAAAAAAAATLALPPYFVPPADAEHFNLFDELDSASAGIFDFTSPLGTFAIAPGFLGVIVELSFFATSADASLAGSAFRVRLDQASPPGYSAIRVPQTGATAFWNTDKAYLRVASNQTITFQFINNLGSAHHVGVNAHGWQWPATEGA